MNLNDYRLFHNIMTNVRNADMLFDKLNRAINNYRR